MKFLKPALLIVLFVSFLLPKNIFALAKFNTGYQITYEINETGITHVKFVINQKNNLSVVYATDFGLSINETKLQNIKVYDEGSLINPDIVKSLNQTSISFPFASKIVGKDKIHTFTIEYDTTDIAVKNGNTWQIDVPRLDANEDVTEQTVVITVPTSFPTPAYMDPKPDIVNGNIYYFSGNKISNKSISAIFGKTQYYRGKITYHLGNQGREKVTQEIALPPDTSYQTVYFQNISPKPEYIKRDVDGNILAGISTAPGENKDITVDVIIKMEFIPKPTNIQPPDSLLGKNSIWNYENSVFNTPEIRNLKSPKLIYGYIVDKLKYDYEKLNRERPSRSPAAESLINNQSAICTDFTDIFVSLARKVGIPSRELEGYAISENPDLKPLSLSRDVLHAWPEYFDKSKSTWTQVDPTWENTTRGIDYFNKLDFNHIVLAIHGEKPDFPVPAGGYKNGSNTKDISFEPIDEINFPSPEFSVEFQKQEDNFLLFKISNNSGVSFYGNARIDGNNNTEKSDNWVNIAPFSSEIIRQKIKKQPFIGKIDSQAIIYINGNRYQSGYTITSATSKAILYSGIGGFLGLITLGAWHLHLRRQPQKTSLYR